jgi:protocatechuate 3,4-dioxygenase beta subunit
VWSQIDRRRLLRVLGVAGVGGLVGACAAASEESAGAPTTSAPAPGVAAAPATTTTTSTTTATVPAFGANALAGRFEGANACALTPETIAGPSYLQVDALRSDIREDQPGAALRLGLRVLDESCTPIPDAAVELWNCDAQGLYSGYPQRTGDTTGQTYLRGTQVTDGNGIVAFVTIYPGWYRTRTAHLHAKVLLSSTELLTTQLYFDDAVTTGVYSAEPYASHTGQDTFNDTDSMFEEATVLSLSQEAYGYLGLLNLTVQR